MATIYSITDKYKMIQSLIEEGADAEVFAEALQAIDGEAAEKLEGYAMVIKNITSDIEGLKAEEKRLAERRKSMENSVARMKNAMEDALYSVEGKKLKTDKFTFSFRKSKVVEILDETAIPNEFVEVKRTISRVELKKRLVAGEEIKGATLVENQSLSIC